MWCNWISLFLVLILSSYQYECSSNYESTDDLDLSPQNRSPITNRRFDHTRDKTNTQVKEERRPISRYVNGTFKIANKNKISFVNRRGTRGVDETHMGDVKFPGPTSKTTQNFIPKVPEECRRNGICEEVDQYPDEYVDHVVTQLGDDIKKLKIDELQNPDIAQRLGHPEEIALCEYQTRLMIPRAAENKDGQWFYIVNKKKTPLQGYHVEICREENQSCSNLAYFYSNYTCTCKQKYVLRYMTALDHEGKVVDRSFKVPSCCSCVITPGPV